MLQISWRFTPFFFSWKHDPRWHGNVTCLLTITECMEFRVSCYLTQIHILNERGIRVQMKWAALNTLRPRQNGRRFADDIFKSIFLNENAWMPIKISLKFVHKGPINNIPALVQIMAWRRPGDKPLSGPMMERLPTHICVTRPQWVNQQWD